VNKSAKVVQGFVDKGFNAGDIIARDYVKAD